jgi:hypothetical protein
MSREMTTGLDRLRNSISERVVFMGRRAQRLIPRLIFDNDGDYRKSVLLVGSGRSGTSWVPDVLNHDHRYRYIYEPFHSMHVPMARNWLPRQYVRPDDRDAERAALADAILSGRIRNGYADAYNKCVFVKQRLIKDTRLQLALKWIRTRYPELPIVYLMRHPCAVVNSRIQLQRDSDLARQFFGQPDLMTDFLQPFRAAMENAKDAFERHLFIWCVENYVPLRQLEPSDVHFVFYEDVCTDPRGVLEKLRAYLGLPFDERALERVNKPSIQARKYHGGGTSAIVTGASLVDAWKKYVPAERIRGSDEILAMFGLDALYGADGLPNADGAQAMLRASAAS